MIKVCEKYYVGFNNRTYEDEKFLLSYIVKDKTLTGFKNWRNEHIAIKEIDNIPKVISVTISELNK